MSLYERLQQTKKQITINYKKNKREELIEKVKNKLSNMSSEISEIDYNNLFKMIRMSDRLIDYFLDLHIDLDNTKKNKKNVLISKEILFSLTREIIEIIDKDYVQEFDLFVKQKRITFSNFPVSSQIFNLTPNNLDKTRYMVFGNSPKIAYIQLTRCFNYSDVVSLVHEFMHHTNRFLSSVDDVNSQKYTEYISIYFEFFALDYLVNEKNVKKEDINCEWRLSNTKKCTHYFYNMIIIYLYKLTGDISFKQFCDFVTSNNIHVNVENFDEYLKNINKMINNNDKFEDIIEKAKRYFLGTLLAFSTRENYNPSYALEFNKSLTSNKYDKDKAKEIERRYEEIEKDDSVYIGMDKYINKYLLCKKMKM